MKRSLLTYLSALSLLAIACSGPKEGSFERTASGIVIHLGSESPARLIRLEPITDEIIHVTASPVDSFVTEKSLMILPELGSTASWDIHESPGEVMIQTARLQATVSLKTGEIVFRDSTGKVILQEQQGGGKTFTETQIEGQKSYSIRQVFESLDDEAFYGLGAHQNGQMNYKGQDVEMAQHNIVDVIPFLYSSKNYGILWDNYSISKFGDPRDYQPLNTVTLFDKNGKQGGLSVDYYVEDKIVKSLTEDRIEYEFLETPQVDTFPKDIAQRGKVVWEGSFTSAKSGLHKFLIYASGYFKVWIDDKIIMDKWRQGWNPWTNKFNVEVREGEKHTVKIEWTPDGGAYLAVKHLDPIPVEEQNKLSLSSEAGNSINYYFVKGSNADEVIHGYRELTGKAPIPPKWSFGFWQSRERYHTQKELLDAVKEYRKRNIPLDNIVLDWQYWEDPKWGSHEFDELRFPDPRGMIDELHHNLHANLMISVWPKFNKGTKNYDAMNEKGYLFTRNIEKGRKDWVGIGYQSTFYDPFNEEAGKLFWKQIDDHLNVLGVDAWWLDATEPDMHSNLSIEERKKNMSPTALGPGAVYFNAYSLMNSKSVYEGQRASSPDKRVFILTRSAYAGQQRYGAVTWSGDIVSRWSDFKDQVAAGINFSLSGIPYWTMDIGGFAVERRYEKAVGETINEWRELNTRWFQFGAFCPVFRSHGQYPFREIYNLAETGSTEYKSMVFYDKLRYRLMPYVYSLAGDCYLNDFTMMRGLVMDFDADEKVHSIGDQYMFGPSLLINPVYEYKARSREVYLPQSTDWYDLYTGELLKGGQTITANAPLDRMPIYVKAGSIIPAGPEIQYSTEKPANPIALYVYEGRDASFTLYEDENVNYNYEQGNYAQIPIHYNEATRTVTIEKRNGAFPGMLTKRTFQIVSVSASHPVGLGLSAQPGQVIDYSGDPISVNLK
ncbi:MAG TPA: TIM-barrel domain-containing protein [Cyclobacteriaceae bacterium]|nr:TIM-barrel domain-containing protein [Cyclobacteriaceae bacterium]